jgi:predicted TIM-barrel fold metal-dependent hydrolase
MTSEHTSNAREIRESLGHPVIDADGHFVEYGPALARYLGEEGIGDPTDLFADASCGTGTLGIERLDRSERDRGQAVRGPWWATPAENARDIATALIPDLLYERLDELGFDFAVMYPSAGLVFPHVRDEKSRRGACRALNRYAAEMFAPFADRLTPAAVVPMHTPEEAIEALEYAVGELGLKTALIPSFVERPVPRGGTPYNVWFDTLGLDSQYDYDPFWRRAVELGVSLASHSATMGIGFRRSPSNYVHNHIGHFAAAGEALAKSLFLGGVTRRVPGLRLALLEGGVHWGVGLLGDLLSHWEKRNIEAVQTYDPRKVDAAEVGRLLEAYGQRLLASQPGAGASVAASAFVQAGPFDDFEPLQASSAEDLCDRFLPNFYFGCEADDPMTATAFDTSRTPHGRPVRAMFSSDIGHWDVPDMAEVLGEAWENVEEGRLDRVAFRDFVFANAARFYTDTNPDFFVGTAVEEAVAALAEENRR